MNNVNNESIIRKTDSLNNLSNIEYADLYRTKDIYLAAFLISRGFEWFGLEEVKINKNNGKNNIFIYLLFKNRSSLEHTALNYFNTNRSSLNVNCNTFVQSILNVRSIITNPPF